MSQKPKKTPPPIKPAGAPLPSQKPNRTPRPSLKPIRTPVPALKPTGALIKGDIPTSSASKPEDATVNQSVISANKGHQHEVELKKYTNKFKCDMCKQEGQGDRYRCDGCNKQFHVECRWFPKTEAQHEHKYEFRSYNKIFQCIGCKKEGFGGRFRCDQCGDELHPQCRFPKDKVGIGWLPGHTFKFQKQSERKKDLICDACTMDIKGYFYTNYVKSCCSREPLDFHPCCINLNPVLNAGLEVGVKGEQYVLTDKAPSKSKCYLCHKKKLEGWSYVCACGCYCFHVRCVQEAVRQACVNDSIVNIQKALNYVSTSENVAKSHLNSGKHPIVDVAIKIFKVILKMIVSTLLGDPTIGVVHLFKILFLD